MKHLQHQQHQQQILHLLGVVSWVEREQITAPLSHCIWQDQVSENTAIVTLPSLTSYRQISPEVNVAELQAISQTTLQHSSQPTQTIEPIVEEVIVEQPFDVELKVELWCCERLLLVADMHTANEAQQQLWHNIRAGLQKYMPQIQHFSLQWTSLIWLNAHNAVMSDYYLKGFLDYHAQDKQVFVLGKLPFFQENLTKRQNYRYFSSLADMEHHIENKRILWKAIQQYVQSF